MNISIIIPVYDKLPRLKLTLASLENQTYSKNDFEIIIVDNGLTDKTAEYIAKLETKLPLRYCYIENQGRSIARNRGLQEAKGKIIIFIDDDVLLCPMFLEEHIRLHMEQECVVHGKILDLPFLKFFKDPTIGILYDEFSNADIKMLRNKCISERDVLEHFDKSIANNGRYSAMEKAIKKILESDGNAPWIGFTGANVSLSKKWLEDVGGFDERFGANWGCEDMELGYRLYQKGYKFIYGNNAVNYHMSHYRKTYKDEHSITSSYFFEKFNDSKILYLHDFAVGKIKLNKFVELMLK